MLKINWYLKKVPNADVWHNITPVHNIHNVRGVFQLNCICTRVKLRQTLQEQVRPQEQCGYNGHIHPFFPPEVKGAGKSAVQPPPSFFSYQPTRVRSSSRRPTSFSCREGADRCGFLRHLLGCTGIRISCRRCNKVGQVIKAYVY